MLLQRETDGFTLIELLVVLVIVGILLMIAAPGMLGYINAAREMRDTMLLDSIHTACNSIAIERGWEIEDVVLKRENEEVNVSVIVSQAAGEPVEQDKKIDVTDEVESLVGEISFSDMFDPLAETSGQDGSADQDNDMAEYTVPEIQDTTILKDIYEVCCGIAKDRKWSVDSIIVEWENGILSVSVVICMDNGESVAPTDKCKVVTDEVKEIMGNISFSDEFEKATWYEWMGDWIFN